MSRDLNTLAPYEVDGRWEGPIGDILVEVKRTNSMRDVRDALLALAYLVRREPPTSTAVCVLVASRLSYSRLHDELHKLREVVHPGIADRIHFLVDKSDASRNVVAFSGSLEDASSDFYTWLENLVAAERLRGHRPQLPPRQMVVAALAQLRLWNHPPVTVKYLQEACRVSYPTVATALKDLAEKGWLEDSGERGVRLRHLTIAEWMELARDHSKQRRVHLFTDPTGQISPEQMVKRLTRLQSANKLPRSVRIGGVLGASRHFPELDITAAPRLDLSVDADPVQVAEMLDAGLRLKTGPEQRIALAVHVTRDPWVITDAGPEAQNQCAGELECLADLIEMGFTREASELAHHMELTNKEGRPPT
jgi:hypothetical protein